MATITILDSNSDLDRICRLCLDSDKKLFNIFETESEPSEWTVVNKIMDSTSLQVQEDDGLPCRICSVCRTLLDAFHKFKRKCITSDEMLRDYLHTMDSKFEVKSESGEDFAESRELNRTDDNTTEDVITLEPNSSPPPDSRWSCQAVDVEVKVEITETDSENRTGPRHKKKYRRINSSNSTLLKGLYPCSQCDKKFFHKNSLTRHEFIHSDEKFECVYCKKTLSTRETLLRHVSAHRGQKPHKCETCGNEYTSNTSYLAHVRKHTGERPYQCNECEESFSLPSSLARHIAKKHKKEKSFCCDLCGAAFWVYDDLRSHVNRVH